MSFRTGLLPSLLRTQASKQIFARSFHFLPTTPLKPTPSAFHLPKPRSQIAIPRTLSTKPKSRLPLFTLGLAFCLFSLHTLNPTRKAQCAAALPYGTSVNSVQPEVGAGQPEAKSILSVYELSFGAVCGVCAGVFVKKGLKAIAFLLGGVFVLMQYFSTKKFISVDWTKMANSYDSTFGTKTATGSRAPTVGGVYAWFVDFVTANFQQRASFLAGFALGIRLG